MELVLQIAPLAVLLIGAVVLVWRGMARKPDNTANKARGGGADSHYQGPGGPH